MAFVTSKGSSIVNATVIDKHPSKSENLSVHPYLLISFFSPPKAATVLMDDNTSTATLPALA